MFVQMLFSGGVFCAGRAAGAGGAGSDGCIRRHSLKTPGGIRFSPGGSETCGHVL